MSKLDPAVKAALKDVNAAAMKRILDNMDNLGDIVNGWVVTKDLGVYGTEKLHETGGEVAAFGWPANLQLDAVYPYTTVDNNGKTLNGANKYTLTFAKGETSAGERLFGRSPCYEVESDRMVVRSKPAEQVYRQRTATI